MQLTVKRKIFTDKSTIGELYINGSFQCYTLEDVDRDLYATQPITEIAQKKLFGKTAIPYGTYDLAMTYSSRFGKMMPQVLNVPAFDGIRIHSGNTDADTLGCLLVGETKGDNFIGNSRAAYAHLLLELNDVWGREKVTITYAKDSAT